MKSLEAEIIRIDRLRCDLSAKKVIQEEILEKGEEILGDASWNYGMPTGKYENDRLIQPEITEPDTQKREAAKTQLQQIYDSSKWYSARYMAAVALGVSKEEINTSLNKLVDEIYKNLLLPRTRYIKTGEHKETRWVSDYICKHDYLESNTVSDYNDEPISENIEIINQTITDLCKLFQLSRFDRARDLLKARLYNFDKDKSVRVKAGKALGYSNLRIWAQVHPVATTLTGIASAGVATGLVYTLVEYLSK
jgi:hypothetical protein